MAEFIFCTFSLCTAWGSFPSETTEKDTRAMSGKRVALPSALTTIDRVICRAAAERYRYHIAEIPTNTTTANVTFINIQ